VGWVEEHETTGPPLITVAALGARTRVLRLVACVRAGEHPLAIAEAAAVADNCTNGRLVLALASDDAALLGETVDAVLAATAARPFRHEGARWTIPAGLPENDGAEERIVVTPACVQLELPVWAAGAAAGAVAAERAIAAVAEPDRGGAWPQPAAARTPRPAIWDLPAGDDGAFDADAVVERLRAGQREHGMDLAVLRLPARLGLDARLAAIARLATHVRPRVVQVPLPAGLEAYWETELAAQLERHPSP
jgi:hypothetical protein